jgi:hypothetical protein
VWWGVWCVGCVVCGVCGVWDAGVDLVVELLLK